MRLEGDTFELSGARQTYRQLALIAPAMLLMAGLNVLGSALAGAAGVAPIMGGSTS
ncbi:hypothetical protein HD597_000253 [Nonomuraea thailandensis]|uniref:Uncharacterized protein n=1 Tax=Nonomuraea thailandensis TaxID=1188745 RepID=A0A9X2GFQ1_9ACTN|nr:hypothetical protein [Nonomuraea thailandensis]MCP2353233.1 hypothetical protein [Nonomuraea thailandensis]